MKRNLLLIALIVICLSSQALAQSDVYQRAFNWFPDGAYSSYGYVNVEEARKAESFDGYVSLMGLSKLKVIGNAPDLPNMLYRNVTFASFVIPANYDDFVKAKEIRDYMFKVGFKFDADPKAIEEMQEKIKSQQEIVRNQKNNSFWVLQIPMIREILAELVTKGSLVSQDSTIGDFPVYLHKGGTGERDIKHYLLCTETDELLVAGSLHSLKTMLEAGQGTRAKLLDNQDYAEAVASTPEESLIWSAISSLAILNKQLLILENEQAGEEEVNLVKEKFAGSELFAVTVIALGEDIRTRSISIYSSEEDAAAAFQETAEFMGTVKNFTKKAFKEAAKVVKDNENVSEPERMVINAARNATKSFMEKQSYELEGKMCIQMTVWEKKMVKMLGQAEQMRREQEKLQQEKKNKEQGQEN